MYQVFLRGHVLILHVLDQSLWSRYSAMIVILLDVIVQLGYFLIHLFLSDFYTSRLFLFACPPRHTAFIYVHIGPTPCRQTKNRRLFYPGR